LKTLRAKLFVSIGTIFLVTACLSTVISQIWIKKDMTKNGRKISDKIEAIQKHITQFGSFLLTFHIIDEATDLERIAALSFQNFSSIQKHSDSLWEQAREIITYGSDIAFVQIQNEKGETAIITPKDAKLYSFSWAPLDNKELLIHLLETNEYFLARPSKENSPDVYLLFNAPKELIQRPNLSFQEVNVSSSSYNWEDSPAFLYNALLASKNQWLEKLSLIEQLVPWQEQKLQKPPLGILQINKEADKQGCLLAREVFSTEQIVSETFEKPDEELPFLMLRKTNDTQDINLFKVIDFPQSEVSITLGVSLSSLLQEVAILINRSIIATTDHFSLGFSAEGKQFDLQQASFPIQDLSTKTSSLSWQGTTYFSSVIDLNILKLFVLTSEEQATGFNRFLEALRSSMILKILICLSASSLFSFIIALFFLNNISKKTTQPIALLSKASEELSKGEYNDLVLPQESGVAAEVSTLAHSFQGMISALKDRDKIRGVLNKVVSKEISEEILKQGVELGGEEKMITLLFSDIRNFTHLAEGFAPHLLIEMLNTYMTRMCRIIDKTHGVVDKFVGDEIMTLYGAPLHLEKHAVQAIEAALLMIKALFLWNEERKQKQEPTFEVGIGIHTGVVYAGNMGAENRLNYTVIGSNVNLASRICSIAHPMQILISEATFLSEEVAERFLINKLEPTLVKGIQHPIELYEVIGKK
jgi:class 3 adenylate cyclase